MWTISDFSAYGMLCKWSMSRILACPCCMEFTRTFRLEKGKKKSWSDCHLKFLDLLHPFSSNKSLFWKDCEEHSPSLSRLTGDQIWDRVREFPKITETGGKELPKEDDRGVYRNWDKCCIF